ncbi:MAG: hypothetical protein ACPGJV_02875 [Bacteriovoracaceae bacterium]
MKAYLNNFSLQVIISTLPNSIIVVFIPLFLEHLGIQGVYLGLAFTSVRLLSILGGLSTPYFLRRFPPSSVSFGAEVLNFGLIVVAILALHNTFGALFFIAIILKGSSIGLINTTRFYWLKNLEDKTLSKRIFIAVNSIYQSTYGLAGVLYLYLSECENILYYLLYIDAFSSLLGAFLFYSLRSFNVREQEVNSSVSKFFEIFRFPFAYLTLMDFTFALAMGGINVLLVKYGSVYLENFGGYGGALLIYGIFYFLGGVFINKNKNDQFYDRLFRSPYISLGLLLGFSLLAIGSDRVFFSILGLVLIFFLGPVYSLVIQSKWLDLSPGAEASQYFASRTFLVQVVMAVGESLYAALSKDIYIRILLVVIFFLLNVFVSKKIASTERS